MWNRRILSTNKLQPCGERVLMTLAAQYPQYVKPLIYTTFNNLVGESIIASFA